MSGPDDPFSFDAEFGDPDCVKAARDPNRPPDTGPEWEPGGRAADVMVVKGNGPAPFDDPNDDAATTDVDKFKKTEAPAASEGETVTPLIPDREALLRFAALMFKNASPDGFVSLRAFRDNDRRDEKPILIEAIRLDDPDFAAIVLERARQAAAWDDPAVYCPPVATFKTPRNAKADNLREGVDLSTECDQSPQAARSTLEALLGPATCVVESGGEWTNPETGEIEPKVHLHWRLKTPTSTGAEHGLLKEARTLAANLVCGDGTNKSVVHPIRWPGSWHRKKNPRLAKIVASSYDSEIDLTEAIEILREATGAAAFAGFGFGLDFNNTSGGRKLEAEDHAAAASALTVIPNTDLEWVDWNRIGMATWAATGGSEIGRKAFAEWSAKSSKNDPAATEARWQHYRTSSPTKLGFGSLVYLARLHSPGWTFEGDLKRLNKLHAVLPIGGKTRVVTFGELEEFPGRETIVMTQSVGDFRALLNKYRHAYKDEKGKPQEAPMGNYWIGHPKRRQYDGGMAFIPKHDGDVGDRLNLWRGFGVKAAKPAGKNAGDGCARFLYFMLNVICSGNKMDFEYLLKREAFILQERTRSEVALALQTREEGCGKGFYERALARLYGNHAMQLGNADHITGKFNPHLETLLRVVADEALFVGDPKHRNALFGLITEPTLTIEPKGCGVYTANSYLNVTILSNSEHFVPVSNTARRFFIPTVSATRRGDHAYFAGLQEELDGGGYEALLYHLLHEVDLTGFNVRQVPQTEGLRHQRDQSLPALEAWWCELLESGTLRGSDPARPNKAVSNGYVRIVEVETVSFGTTISKQPRTFNQPGLFDQARQIEPRLKNYTNDHLLGGFLRKMGCDNTRKVLRRQGWTFPPLSECRSEWEKNYPGWKWRNPDLKEWQPEGDDFGDFADLKHLDAADVIDILDKKQGRKT